MLYFNRSAAHGVKPHSSRGARGKVALISFCLAAYKVPRSDRAVTLRHSAQKPVKSGLPSGVRGMGLVFNVGGAGCFAGHKTLPYASVLVRYAEVKSVVRIDEFVPHHGSREDGHVLMIEHRIRVVREHGADGQKADPCRQGK